jgi:multidrug efflux pump subunit AcrA (membrane-fusion protein)
MDKQNDDWTSFSYEGSNYKTLLTDKFRAHQPYEPEDLSKITAQIPGTIIKIFVKEGQLVNPTKCLFILDAMKMRNKVFASISGQIDKIHVTEGQTVTKNQLLLELSLPEPKISKKEEKKLKEQERKEKEMLARQERKEKRELKVKKEKKEKKH